MATNILRHNKKLWIKELKRLAGNMNRCFRTEEKLRLKSIQEEQEYREMIANLSHDLRTLLTAIKGYQQLMEKGELTEKQQKHLAVARKHAEELGQLIEHFFEYSYLLNIQPEVKLERVNLANVVTECPTDSVAAIEKRKLSVHY